MTTIGPSLPSPTRTPITARLNQQALEAVDRLAFDAYGDLDLWAKQAKRLAVVGADYAAKSAMLLNGGRVDGADVQAANGQAIETAQARYASTAHNIAHNGYGDIDYWSKRAKRLAFETAATAAITASLCDGPMLASVQDQLVTAIRSASTMAFDGYGDTGYWSARTKQMERAISMPAPRPAQSGPAGTPADGRQKELAGVTRRYLDAVGTRAFDGYGDIAYWSKESKRIALHTATHVARVSMIDAAATQKSDAEQDTALTELETLGRQFARVAQEAGGGYGDIDYWSKRTRHLALDTAQYVAQMAIQCDGEMVATLRPAFEKLLSQVEDVAFNGYGDVSYWKDRCHRLGSDAVTALATMRIDLQAARTARVAVQPAPAGSQPHDTQALETAVVSNRVTAREIEKLAEPVRKEVARLDVEAAACQKELQPLLDAEDAAYRGARLDQKLAIGGGITAIASTVLTGTVPLVGVGMMLLGVGGLCAALYRRTRMQAKVESLRAEQAVVIRRKTQIDNERKQLGQTLGTLEARLRAAEQAADRAQKELDVLRMANAVAPTASTPGTVEVAVDQVRIGGIVIPRNGQ